MLTAKDLSKVLEWWNKNGLNLKEIDLFRVAYFDEYQKAEPRCDWCYINFLETGRVPDFVRKFVTRELVATKYSTPKYL